MDERPEVGQFIELMLNSKYNELDLFDGICKAVTGRKAETLFSTRNGLLPLFPQFAELVRSNSGNLARWTAHLVGTNGGDDFDLRRRVRVAFSARAWPVTYLPPNQVVYMVCEKPFLKETRKLEKALAKAAGLQFKVKVIEVDPQRLAAIPILSAVQGGTFVIECRGDAAETLPAAEFSELMAAATIRDYYIAYLPSYFGSPLAGIPAIDLTSGFDGAQKAIASAFSHVHITSQQQPPPPPPVLGVPPRLAALAESIVNNGLVVCVGADLPERLSGRLPSQGELAIQLLVEAKLIDPSTAVEALRREPLVPNFWAGFLNRLVVTSGNVSIRDWKKELARRIRNSIGLVPSLTSLAEMLNAIQANPPETGQRLVVVTTNVDLALENAFIQAGLAFDAWVLPPPMRVGGAQFSYSAKFEERQSVGNVASVSGIIEDTVIAATEKMRLEYQRDVANDSMTFDDYVRLRYRNRLIGKIYERAAKEERDRLVSGDPNLTTLAAGPGSTLPLLIKLNGSCHDEGDFIASADEDRYQKAALPNPALMGITNSAMVMIGYGLADPSLMDFHASILRERFDVGSNALRVALVDSASWPRTSVVASLLSQKGGTAGSFFGFEVVDTSLEPGLKAIADSYAHAINAPV